MSIQKGLDIVFWGLFFCILGIFKPLPRLCSWGGVPPPGVHPASTGNQPRQPTRAPADHRKQPPQDQSTHRSTHQRQPYPQERTARTHQPPEVIQQSHNQHTPAAPVGADRAGHNGRPTTNSRPGCGFC